MALKEKNRRSQICHFLIDFSCSLKNLGNGWSKSIVLDNKVVLNFDFRHGAKKSGHLELWPNRFQYISIYFTKSWMTLDDQQLDQTSLHCGFIDI